MSNNINLLPSKKKSNKFDDKLLKQSKKISIIFLVATAVVAALVFLLNFDTSISGIIKQKNNTITNLSFTHGKVAKYLLIKDRLDAIGVIMRSRTSYDSVIASIQQQVPNDASIDSLIINDNALSVSVSSESLSSLDSFLTNLTQLLSNKKVVKNMTINNVGSDQSLDKYVVTVKSDLL